MAVLPLPAATTTINSVGEYSSPFFTEFLTYIWPAIGIVVAASLVLFIWRLFADLFDNNDVLMHRAQTARKRTEELLHKKDW